MSSVNPPKIFQRFFEWYCKPALKESILGDLEEQFDEDVQTYSRRKAKRRFAWNVIRFFRPGIIRSLQGSQKLNYYGMFSNYLKVAVRTLLKYKTFSFINVFGLSVSMAIGLIIILMLSDQLSYDQFHPGKDRIVRINSHRLNSSSANASSPFPLAQALKEYPFVQETTQLLPGVGGDGMNLQNGKGTEMRGLFADQQFFTVFGFELDKGNSESALIEPRSIILSVSTAYQMFNDENPIGQTIEFSQRGLDLININLGTEKSIQPDDWGTFVVTGVIDQSKYQSHIQFDFLISMASIEEVYSSEYATGLKKNWNRYSSCYTYALLNSSQQIEELKSVTQDIATREYKETDLEGMKLPVQSLKDIRLGTFLGNPLSMRLPVQAYFVLGFLGLVILISAGLNYTNLSIARGLSRAKEIGIRKTNGASRSNLIVQFLAESIIVSLLALILANGLIYLVKPLVQDLWINNLISINLDVNLRVFGIFLAFASIVGLSAGFYPALVLSRFSPTKVLKSITLVKPEKIGFRKAITVIQFSVSLFFIISTLLVYQQFKHFMDFQYGFNAENVINIPIQGNNYQILKDEFSILPGVESVSASQLLLGMPNANGTFTKQPGTEDSWIKSEYSSIDDTFLANMQLDLVAGNNFNRASSNSDEVIINKWTLNILGYQSPHEAIGERIVFGASEVPYKIIGVINDFKFQTPVMGDGKMPLIFWNRPADYRYLNVRISSNEIGNSIEQLKAKWSEIDPIHPFKWNMYDEQLTMANLWFADLFGVIGLITFLAILISCLGLLGMVIYNTERRIKEVSVRKILGANGTQIMMTLGKSFGWLIVLSVIVATPVSYLINNLWLSNFPNAINFGFDTILIGIGMVLLIAGSTIVFQILSVANRNPAETLRND